jgi:hypothetical protein
LAKSKIITIANKLSSVLTDTGIVSKAIRKRDDIVSKSILVDVELTAARIFVRNVRDLFSTNDEISLLNTKSILDEISFQDIIVLAKLTPIDFFDDVGVDDSFTFELFYNRSHFDTLSVNDLRVLLFSKNLQDTFILLDNINNQINKNFTDNVSTQSSGYLISQGYTVDNTYFLEDYVGEYRTFT